MGLVLLVFKTLSANDAISYQWSLADSIISTMLSEVKDPTSRSNSSCIPRMYGRRRPARNLCTDMPDSQTFASWPDTRWNSSTLKKSAWGSSLHSVVLVLPFRDVADKSGCSPFSGLALPALVRLAYSELSNFFVRSSSVGYVSTFVYSFFLSRASMSIGKPYGIRSKSSLALKSSSSSFRYLSWVSPDLGSIQKYEMGNWH